MRTRPVLLLVTMLTAALIVVGRGVASAGPCIPDGQTCRTDQSCCSGVCVKEAKKSFGTCCSPTTCAAVGSNCGMIADGCGGTLDCGTCTLPQTCGGGGTPNVCGSTTTTSTTTTTTTTTTTNPSLCGNGTIDPGEQCDGDLGDCVNSGFSCRPPGVSGECTCCGGPAPQLVGCCNPSSILIPAPEYGGTCVATRCDPPFSCTGNDVCQPDGSCCSPPGETCLLTLLGQPLGLNACCGVAECRGPSPFGLSCCVPDAASCSTDAECCTGHCTSGSCDACRAGGAACANPFECCSLSCTSGTCDACAAGGSGCISGTTCCSGVCDPSTLTCVG